MSGFLKSLFSKPQVEEQVQSGTSPEGSSDSQPIHVTDETFADLILSSSMPSLVDFWAPWCGPCRMITPIVEQLAIKYQGRVQVAKVNTDEQQKVASGLQIQGIPTLIIFKDGREADRIVGFVPSRAIEEKLDAVLG